LAIKQKYLRNCISRVEFFPVDFSQLDLCVAKMRLVALQPKVLRPGAFARSSVANEKEKSGRELKKVVGGVSV
jgi:hypothetical protein